MGAECFVSRLRFTLLPWSPKQGLLIAVAGTFFFLQRGERCWCCGEREGRYLIAEFGPRGINGRETRGIISKDSENDVIQTGLLDG